MMPQHPEHETLMSPDQRAYADLLIEKAQSVPAYHPERPTSYRGEAPAGTGAQPVPQHDPSFWGAVPKWALGTFLAAPAIGAGAIGCGYGAKLFFDSVTTEGVVMVGVIIGGTCMVIAMMGSAASKMLKSSPGPAPTINVHGPVHVDARTSVDQKNKAFSFNRTKIGGA